MLQYDMHSNAQSHAAHVIKADESNMRLLCLCAGRICSSVQGDQFTSVSHISILAAFYRDVIFHTNQGSIQLCLKLLGLNSIQKHSECYCLLFVTHATL